MKTIKKEREKCDCGHALDKSNNQQISFCSNNCYERFKAASIRKKKNYLRNFNRGMDKKIEEQKFESRIE